jgi:putative transposase
MSARCAARPNMLPEGNMFNHPDRKSPRLIGYDYSQNGLYFLTICSHGRLPLFGNIQNDMMHLNAAGEMAANNWNALSTRFAGVSTLDYCIMPNHVHGIVLLEQSIQVTDATSITKLMQWFKTMTTNAYIKGVKEAAWEAFDQKLWQRSFYDHIIRSEAAYEVIARYIAENPARWETDTFRNRW